jgi:hypothetical protein
MRTISTVTERFAVTRRAAVEDCETCVRHKCIYRMFPMLYDRLQSSLYIATVTCCYLLLLSYGGIVPSRAEDDILPQAADALSLTISTPFEYSYHNEDIASDHSDNVRQRSSSGYDENERSAVSQAITSTTRGIHRRRLMQYASLFILDFLADNNNSTRTDEGDFSDYMTVRIYGQQLDTYAGSWIHSVYSVCPATCFCTTQHALIIIFPSSNSARLSSCWSTMPITSVLKF